MTKLFKEIDDFKKEIDSYKPFSPHILKQLKEYYRIGLTFASNALEGNSLTETETKIVLEDGLTVGGKPIREYLEALGHSSAYDYMFSLIAKSEIKEKDIKKLHYLFYRYIDDKNCGKYRKENVFITGSKYILPKVEEVPELMVNYIGEIQNLRKQFHPLKFAALVHKEFVFIHPFIDGNGRVARLLMNLALLQEGYTIAVIPPILRAEYINMLEKAHEEEQDFIVFIAERVKETQKDYLRLLKSC